MYSQVQKDNLEVQERIATLRKSLRYGGASLWMANHKHCEQQHLNSTFESVHFKSAPSRGSMMDVRKLFIILLIKPAEAQ